MVDSTQKVLNFAAGPAKLPEEVSHILLCCRIVADKIMILLCQRLEFLRHVYNYFLLNLRHSQMILSVLSFRFGQHETTIRFSTLGCQSPLLSTLSLIFPKSRIPTFAKERTC